MKIERLEAFVVGNPWKNWVLVKITSDGVVGWGDATTPMSTKPVMAAIEELKRLCIGHPVGNIEALRSKLFRTLYLTDNATLLAAMAGIETAMWDIKGRMAGVPLTDFLGGRVRDRVRAYANGWYSGARDEGFVRERAAHVVELGYTGLKIDPFGAAYRLLDRSEYKASLRLLSAIRESVGDEVDVIVEFHDRFSVTEALRIINDIADIKPLWIEAPVWSTNTDALKAVIGGTTARIAAGERFTKLSDFAALLHTGRVDVVLPEYVELGGISRLRQVAAIAEAHEAMIAPHNARCPLSTAVNVSVDLATANVFIQESFDDFHVEWSKDLFHGLPKVVNGFYEAESRPGIGVEVNEELFADHPYSVHNFLNFFEGGWEDRFKAKP